MSHSNAIIIKNIPNGMFQYFLCFNDSEKMKSNAKKFSFNSYFHTGNNFKVPNVRIETIKIGKKVRFNNIHNIQIMHVWQFAYAQARRDKWQEIARDRLRFHNKITEFDQIISPILRKSQAEISQN